MRNARVPSGNGKCIGVYVDVWYDSKNRAIAIADHDGNSFISTISTDPASKSHHASLYGQLKRLLEKHGKWPKEATG